MASSHIALYRLIYFQPNPEDGERVSVALLFQANGDVELLYDPHFPKLKCLAPYVDLDLIRIYLDDMAVSLKRRPSNVDSIVGGQTAQLVASEVRKVSWPLSNEERIYLMKRFLSKEGHLWQSNDLAKSQKSDQIKEHLKLLLEGAKIGRERLRENASPEWILGRKVPRIKPVALALRRKSGVLLIDGVDLSVLSTKATLTRVSKVAYTFFQYGRLRQMSFDRPELKRIGVVLNGVSDPGSEYRDAHDFALHEFTQEADLAVDTTSASDLERFQAVLMEE
ncbi:MAG TPA: hypothetical protein VGN86_04960 [Pyrinomonadaceae bacterium]|jgi:hypothetical protein|nr:hypothetical protein [Pyrinomonadaceae bacterium]